MTCTADERFMLVAISMAWRAALAGDMPFGAVAVDSSETIIAAAASSEIADRDRTAHAEMHVIRAASEIAGPDLHGITLYSTHELCAMCSCAALHAEVGRIVVGSERADLRHLFRAKSAALAWLIRDSSHQPQITTGVMRDQAIALLDAYLPDLLHRPRRPLARAGAQPEGAP